VKDKEKEKEKPKENKKRILMTNVLLLGGIVALKRAVGQGL
jgi:hypothetical protein